MAPKLLKPSTSSRLRVRDNQRRARARQREYIQNLETALEQYKVEGVAATKEVQAAAKDVLQENGRLRQENSRLREELTGLALRSKISPDKQQEQGEQLHVSEQRFATSPTKAKSGVDSENLVSAADGQPSTDSRLSNDTSSCEYAAQIILGMRADATAEDVCSELGCDTPQSLQNCTIDNARLFSTVDRYTG